MAKKSPHAVELDPSMRIVVLYGQERFLIEEHTRRFAQMLEEKFGGLQQFRFDGETAEPAAVLDELRSYGLLQQHKLVILDNAEVFLAGGKNASHEDEIDEDESGSPARSTRRPLMERYAENPVAEATLLMRAETWRAGKLDKAIAKAGGGIYELQPLNDAAAAKWCVKRCEKRYDSTLAPEAAELLVARLGPQLQHLDTELMKLAAMAGSRGTINREAVSESIGLSREEKAWQIQSAIVSGDAAEMLCKLRELLEVSRQDVVPIMWAICDVLRKLHAASQLLRRGVPAGAVRGQLKLWGDTTEPILHIALHIEPAILAQLLRQAIDTDMHNKSGQGDPVRNVERMLVRIADTLSMSGNLVMSR
jgi:DNA polymerase-3 subunit delta